MHQRIAICHYSGVDRDSEQLKKTGGRFGRLSFFLPVSLLIKRRFDNVPLHLPLLAFFQFLHSCSRLRARSRIRFS